MITYTCDSCMAPIEGSVRISARGDRNHFCSPVCLSVWWTYKAITRARAAAPQARDAARDADRDAIAEAVAEAVGLTWQVVDRVVDAAEAAAPVTARCCDCPRTWNLTGRVLKLTVDLHEHQRGHVVDVEEGALDA
ncbi:HTH DNA binding protein [Mycobacterium phage Taj]|uniref:Helix-turn-helix DNA binding domain protein n=2 Tax=Cheoctovirus TaxID=1623281 RepID=E7EJU3_9CAUD|nr:HTH DNA binding protein [Mycobacterium phage Wee]YP_009100188.1 HTH DNA binding protein [Mycobacterium phage Taj]ADU15947.1 helix-turn-helix DNA binding domain protein [Mycobacterium phage Wee]AFO10200.1 helix-turn-helix DNA binding domain protein [Mycobacterium phage Taj]